MTQSSFSHFGLLTMREEAASDIADLNLNCCVFGIQYLNVRDLCDYSSQAITDYSKKNQESTPN